MSVIFLESVERIFSKEAGESSWPYDDATRVRTGLNHSEVYHSYAIRRTYLPGPERDHNCVEIERSKVGAIIMPRS